MTDKIKDRIKNIEMPKRNRRNLTLLEAKGQKWCKRMISQRKLYITRVDKGGCIIILDANEVHNIMMDTLENRKKYEKLKKDPRDEIKKKIKKEICEYASRDLLSPEDVFAITGITRRGGMSHGHEFVVGKPYMYPLFKLHKLTPEQIERKMTPPTRMVTSGVGGPTFRLGSFIDALLKPIVLKYCAGELVRDSSDFLTELTKMECSGLAKQMKLIGTLDVDALYPNIRLEIALRAIKDALDTVTDFLEEYKEMIVHLSKLCIEHSVIHYRGMWYCSKEGIPTGGPESGSIANLVVYFVLEKVLLPHPAIAHLNRLTSRKRFLDDLWFGWLGTQRQFSIFKSTLNKIGCQYGITFKGDVGNSIDFLDVTVRLTNDHFSTKMFVKPTDASRYLHRRSDHALHTFKSIPYSQFRRAVVLCSEPEERIQCIDYIAEKLKNSGYKPDEIFNAKKKALALNRDELLKPRSVTRKSETNEKQLTFTVNRDAFMSKKIKEILNECQQDINELLGGSTRIIVAERKTNSTASLVFAKSSFAKVKVEEGTSQECKVGGCKSCKLMDMEKSVTLWEKHPDRKTKIKLDFRLNCAAENVIYLYLCTLCQNNESFYVGQTISSCRGRANGHRADFTDADFRKSALSYHTHEDHPEHFGKKLKNYKLGVIKSTRPMNLDRLEDYYVEATKADLSLNRYKVTTQ